MVIVYVDVLLILNFMINFVLLRAASLLASHKFRPRRAALAAAIGALSALAIFLPVRSVILSGILKLGTSATMVRLTFRREGLSSFLRDVFCLFSVSFLFSGVMLALWLWLAPRGMTVANGIVYFDISGPALLVVTGGCYALVSLLSALLSRRAVPSELCEVIVGHHGLVRVLPALIDNGSTLREPFSGRPAMVCGQEDVADLLPEGFMSLSLKADTAGRNGFRMIPYRAVGGGGVLPAFVPQFLRIRTARGESEAAEGSYVAVSPQRVGTAQYRAIVNPVMIQQSNSKAGESL
ncbi:MAG: sigma-E processing peptidase SpoIIGA [Oscillospiraceae bacterium]